MKLNIFQIVNFVYWITECHDLRGLKKQSNAGVGARMVTIVSLLAEYMRKYPSGELRGFADTKAVEQIKELCD